MKFKSEIENCDGRCLICRCNLTCPVFNDKIINVNELERNQKTIETAKSYEDFIQDKVNEIINKYYKLGYEGRRAVKYLCFGENYFNDNIDLFYISGPKKPQNILQYINNLTPEKVIMLDDFVSDIKLFEVQRFLGFKIRPTSDISFFDKDLISHIDVRIYKDPITKKYKTHFENVDVESLKSKPKLLNEYKKYLKKLNAINSED